MSRNSRLNAWGRAGGLAFTERESMENFRKKLLCVSGLISLTALALWGIYRMMIAINDSPERTFGMWLTLGTIATILGLVWVISEFRPRGESQ